MRRTKTAALAVAAILALTGVSYAACVKPVGDCAKSVGFGTFGNRPSPSKATAGQLYVVSDCSSTACTAGSGTTLCLTFGNTAGTGWTTAICGTTTTTSTSTTAAPTTTSTSTTTTTL